MSQEEFMLYPIFSDEIEKPSKITISEDELYPIYKTDLDLGDKDAVSAAASAETSDPVKTSESVKNAEPTKNTESAKTAGKASTSDMADAFVVKIEKRLSNEHIEFSDEARKLMKALAKKAIDSKMFKPEDSESMADFVINISSRIEFQLMFLTSKLVDKSVMQKLVEELFKSDLSVIEKYMHDENESAKEADKVNSEQMKAAGRDLVSIFSQLSEKLNNDTAGAVDDDDEFKTVYAKPSNNTAEADDEFRTVYAKPSNNNGGTVYADDEFATVYAKPGNNNGGTVYDDDEFATVYAKPGKANLGVQNVSVQNVNVQNVNVQNVSPKNNAQGFTNIPQTPKTEPVKPVTAQQAAPVKPVTAQQPAPVKQPAAQPSAPVKPAAAQQSAPVKQPAAQQSAPSKQATAQTGTGGDNKLSIFRLYINGIKFEYNPKDKAVSKDLKSLNASDVLMKMLSGGVQQFSAPVLYSEYLKLAEADDEKRKLDAAGFDTELVPADIVMNRVMKFLNDRKRLKTEVVINNALSMGINVVRYQEIQKLAGDDKLLYYTETSSYSAEKKKIKYDKNGAVKISFFGDTRNRFLFTDKKLIVMEYINNWAIYYSDIVSVKRVYDKKFLTLGQIIIERSSGDFLVILMSSLGINKDYDVEFEKYSLNIENCIRGQIK